MIPLLSLLAVATTYPMTLHKLEWGADPEGFFHGTAFNFLAPKGWKPFAITGWNVVDTKNVNLLAGAYSPDERFGYVFCPGFWQTFAGKTGNGGSIQGHTLGTEPPARLSDFIMAQTGLGKANGFHVDRRDEHNVPIALLQGERGYATVTSAAFSYTEKGQAMQGVISGRVRVGVFGDPTAPMSSYSGSWGVESYCVVAFPRGEERKGMRFFSLAVPTYTPTKAFLHAVAVHDQTLKQMYANITDGAIRRARAERDLDRQKEAAIMGRYRSDQKQRDKFQQDFCDMIGDVDRYHTADGSEMQLASGYKDAWTNRAGDVVLSDNVGYDPNQGSGGGWTRMRKG